MEGITNEKPQHINHMTIYRITEVKQRIKIYFIESICDSSLASIGLSNILSILCTSIGLRNILFILSILTVLCSHQKILKLNYIYLPHKNLLLKDLQTYMSKHIIHENKTSENDILQIDIVL